MKRSKVKTTRIISVPMSQSTALHLYALAASNNVSLDSLLSKMAGCLADAAGRRPGSWEAATVDRFRDAEAIKEPRDLRATSLFAQGGDWHTGFFRFEQFDVGRDFAHRWVGRHTIDRTGGL